MKSMPASSPIRASARQSSQLADQRSGTLVAERPDEQLAPNSPILSALSLYMATRACMEEWGASIGSLLSRVVACAITARFARGRDWAKASGVFNAAVASDDAHAETRMMMPPMTSAPPAQ